MTGSDRESEGILIEFHRIGVAVKVSAIDPVTNTEVSIVGPATAGRGELSCVAVQKLEYVLAKRAAAKQP